MKRVVVIAFAGAALAGCASHSTYKPPAAKLLRPAAPSAAATLSQPAPVAGLDWFVVNTGGEAKLAFGRPNSDDVRLMMVCAKGSGKVTMSRTVAAADAGETPTLYLGSGSARGKWLASARPSADQAGHVDLTVKTSTTDPAIDAFQRNGWISAIQADGKTEGMAPHPGENAVRRFFDFCG